MGTRAVLGDPRRAACPRHRAGGADRRGTRGPGRLGRLPGRRELGQRLPGKHRRGDADVPRRSVHADPGRPAAGELAAVPAGDQDVRPLSHHPGGVRHAARRVLLRGHRADHQPRPRRQARLPRGHRRGGAGGGQPGGVPPLRGEHDAAAPGRGRDHRRGQGNQARRRRVLAAVARRPARRRPDALRRARAAAAARTRPRPARRDTGAGARRRPCPAGRARPPARLRDRADRPDGRVRAARRTTGQARLAGRS